MSSAGLRQALRYALLGTVLLLGLVTLAFLRGPAFWQRIYYPLHHQQIIAEAAERHRVSPYLIAAVIHAESGWDPQARSQVGARGLMQVMPSTAKELAERGIVDGDRFPYDELFDPATNIEYGSAYLRYLVERYHEIEKALAAYNAGLANVDVWIEEGGDIRDRIEFPATRHFVLKVSRSMDRYEALYPDEFPGWPRR